jgi:predicted ATPase
VPLLGELDVLALGVLAVKTFIEACPEDVRREHEAALKAGNSLFDRDFQDTVSAARDGTGQLVNRIRARVARRDDYQAVSEG